MLSRQGEVESLLWMQVRKLPDGVTLPWHEDNPIPTTFGGGHGKASAWSHGVEAGAGVDVMVSFGDG